MIYAYHTFAPGDATPPDKYRRSEVDFRNDLRAMKEDDEIHIDDGMASAYDIGKRVLQQQFKQATFFICTSKVGTKSFVTEEQVRYLSEYHEVGSHAHEHVDLRTLPLQAVEDQLQKSIDLLEKWTGKRPVKFVAPYEGYNREIVLLARKLGLVPYLDRVTVYNTTEFKEPAPDISSAEYWDAIFAPKAIVQGVTGQIVEKKEPGGHENDRYVEVEKLLGAEGAILDCGAGWAGLAIRLKAKEPERKIVAVDQSMQAKLRSSFTPYECASCYQMPFAYKEFEFLVSCQMLEYVQDNHRALNEFARVANYAIITVPKGKHDTCSQLREYNVDDFKKFLEQFGSDVQVYEMGPIIVSKVKF